MWLSVCFQVFRPDKLNGYDVQSEADAMLERQQRDIMPRMTNTKASNINTPRIQYVLHSLLRLEYSICYILYYA